MLVFAPVAEAGWWQDRNRDLQRNRPIQKVARIIKVAGQGFMMGLKNDGTPITLKQETCFKTSRGGRSTRDHVTPCRFDDSAQTHNMLAGFWNEWSARIRPLTTTSISCVTVVHRNGVASNAAGWINDLALKPLMRRRDRWGTASDPYTVKSLVLSPGRRGTFNLIKAYSSKNGWKRIGRAGKVGGKAISAANCITGIHRYATTDYNEISVRVANKHTRAKAAPLRVRRPAPAPAPTTTRVNPVSVPGGTIP